MQISSCWYLFADFPDQLEQDDVDEVVVEQDNRAGFFQQHIFSVSWRLPESMTPLLRPVFVESACVDGSAVLPCRADPRERE